MIERMTIVTWYTPEEKHPPEGEIKVATISGRIGMVTLDHAFGLVEWFDDGDGYTLSDGSQVDDLVVHAWADLEPYDVPKVWRTMT